VDDGVNPDFFPKERFRATLGVVILYAIAGVAGWLSLYTKRSSAHIPGIGGILRHHQRGTDGNQDSPATQEKPSPGENRP
jgi:hypothetical protein